MIDRDIIVVECPIRSAHLESPTGLGRKQHSCEGRSRFARELAVHPCLHLPLPPHRRTLTLGIDLESA